MLAAECGMAGANRVLSFLGSGMMMTDRRAHSPHRNGEVRENRACYLMAPAIPECAQMPWCNESVARLRLHW
jgi:hypothetical protein